MITLRNSAAITHHLANVALAMQLCWLHTAQNGNTAHIPNWMAFYLVSPGAQEYLTVQGREERLRL